MPDGYALRLGFTGYSANEERMFAAAMMAIGAGTTPALTGRAGVRPGPGGETSIGGSPESVTIAPRALIITDETRQGSGTGLAVKAPTYLCVFPDPVTKQLPTRPASGTSRFVDVIATILNGDDRPADGNGIREVNYQLISGTAVSSGTPGTPALPAAHPNALRTHRMTQPSGTAAISVADIAPRTVALGGTLPISSATEQTALEPLAYPGLKIYRTDTKVSLTWSGTAWLPDKIQHVAAGNLLDATTTPAPSSPDNLKVVTGRVAATTDGNGLVTVTFPAGAFPGGLLSLHLTTISGTGVTPVVNGGAVSKTGFTAAFVGNNNVAVVFTYTAYGF